MNNIDEQEKQDILYYLYSHDQEINTDCWTIIDPSHTINFFEVIKISETQYKIVNIIKNTIGKFNLNDILFLSGGMISYYTMDEQDKIKEIGCGECTIIEKNKIQFYNEQIELEFKNIIKLIKKFEQDTSNELYSGIKEMLEKFIN